ncbi:hypothetical protein AGMMS49938_01170 [Fibrobacterales bacterium]|nr:hypothetical protein AGMMS49938_01170 [Fibrobacterales bacterium]
MRKKFTRFGVRAAIKDFRDFFGGLSGYPALAGAVSAILMLGALRVPQVAFLLAVWLFALNSILRKVSLLVCAVVLFSHFLQNGYFEFAKNPPESGKSFVEETLKRPNGYAVIMQTDFGKARASFSGNPPLPGDSIFWKAKWYPIVEATIPGAFNSPKWMQGEGYKASGALDSIYILSSKFTFGRFSFLVKNAFENRLSKFYAAPERSLLMGLLAGDRSGISESLQNDFRKTGLVHILSISGFHTVMLAGMLTLFLRALRLPHNFARVLSIILLCIYAPITGGSAAVWRAVLMFCVMESGGLFQKISTSINALGVALVIILTVEPEQAFMAGFELSAAATLGILLGQKIKMPSFKGKIATAFGTYLIEPSFITLAATISTLPLLVFHFQTFSPISWLGNLVVVPLVALGMQAGVLSVVCIHPFVCQIFADSATLLLRAGAGITSFLSENPYASSTIGPWSLATLFAVAIFTCTLPFLKEKCGRIIAILSILFCGILFFVEEIKNNFLPSWNAVFLDIGQGDLIVLQSPDHRYYMIDTGPPAKKRSVARDKIIPYLRSQGVSKLEALLITHPDLDHYGNAKDILSEFPVKEFWTTECALTFEKDTWNAVVKMAKSKNIPIKNLKSGLELKEELFLSGEIWKLSILYPSDECFQNPNDNSVALKVQGMGNTLLLTGDLEKQGETDLLQFNIKSDILKLGHHGSKTSSTRQFLEKAKPKIGIISAALKNRYHHPHPSILERLDSLGISHYDTYQMGSIKAEFNKNGISIENYKGEWERVK